VNLIQRSDILCLTISRRVDESAILQVYMGRLCRMVDNDFREFPTSTRLGEYDVSKQASSQHEQY
jgi:hypothetical protein